MVSKLNTLFQLGYIAAVLFVAAVGFLPHDIADALGYVMVITTVLSGADYIYQFTKRAWDQPNNRVMPASARRTIS